MQKSDFSPTFALADKRALDLAALAARRRLKSSDPELGGAIDGRRAGSSLINRVQSCLRDPRSGA
jgi:hypothetical protein